MRVLAHEVPHGLAGHGDARRPLSVVKQPETERLEYLLLATNKTSTMQEELTEAGSSGFAFVGVTVAETRFGGSEVVSILRRPVGPGTSN